MSAARPIIYSGQGFALRGEKERLVLPAAFRKAVRDSSEGRVLCLAAHDRWKCLVGFGLSRGDELAAQLDREEDNAIRRGDEFDRDARALQLYGFLQISFDDSGRFMLPDHLASGANFTDGVYFQGGGSYFTLWSPEELYRMPESFAGSQAACRALEAEARGRKA